jgi:hypothetical protein
LRQRRGQRRFGDPRSPGVIVGPAVGRFNELTCPLPWVQQRPEPSAKAGPDDNNATCLRLASPVIRRELARARRHEVRGVAKSFAIDNVDAPGQNIISRYHMMLRSSSDCPFVIGGAGCGANRNSRPARIFHGLCRIGDHRDSLVWAARCSADHRSIFGYTPAFWTPLAFFAGPATVDRGFCSSGARSVLRQARRSPPRASPAEGRVFGRRPI